MHVPPINSALPSAPAAEPAWARALSAPVGMPNPRGVPEQPGAEDVKKAAAQFEAILLRQLLGPSIEPMMSGGLGGGSAASGGGSGVYSYLLTDVLCSSLGSAGGLGLGRMLEQQLSPAPKAASARQLSPVNPSV